MEDIVLMLIQPLINLGISKDFAIIFLWVFFTFVLVSLCRWYYKLKVFLKNKKNKE